ncbi:MAG: HNH endonuclease [Saprospiraceae bacterium]|nr:HNH endonuclease [Candidatus Vicinibacter affinis]
MPKDDRQTMKFELTDLRKQITDIEIINDLRTVANYLGKKSLKMREYCKDNGSKYNYQIAKKRFGSWEKVLQKAGLETEKSIHGIEYGETSLKTELLIDDLISVSKKLNNPKFTIAEYDEYGKYGSATIQKRFRGWNNAKRKANLEIGRNYNTPIEDYLQNILDLWTHYGRQPKYAEVVKPLSKYNISSYENKFGSWRLALEQFIEYVNSDKENINDDTASQIIELNETKISEIKESKNEAIIKRTPRGINLRLRFAVLKRDNFSCKKCGRAPAKDPSIILHVDHITPWSKGGETVIGNLEALCEQCNLGKSNVL